MAFTLIELLIVIAIIAILALIAVPNFLEAQIRAKVTRTYADMKSLAVAFEAYYIDWSHYPPDWDSDGSMDEGRTYANLTTPIAYITKIPDDVFTTGKTNLHTGKSTPYFQYVGWSPGGGPPQLQRLGVQYIMSTVGPDLKDDLLWAHAYRGLDSYNRSYNPTNGTVSSGDIARSNIGFVPD